MESFPTVEQRQIQVLGESRLSHTHPIVSIHSEKAGLANVQSFCLCDCEYDVQFTDAILDDFWASRPNSLFLIKVGKY